VSFDDFASKLEGATMYISVRHDAGCTNEPCTCKIYVSINETVPGYGIPSRKEDRPMTIAAQTHSKFKVFVTEKDMPYATAIRQLNGMVEAFTRDGKIAVKSVGLEHLTNKQVILSLGYRDDESGYPVKITAVSLGALQAFPDAIEKAMTNEATAVENVICHELTVDDDGVYGLVLLSHA
jgi:hypothetical protein